MGSAVATPVDVGLPLVEGFYGAVGAIAVIGQSNSTVSVASRREVMALATKPNVAVVQRQTTYVTEPSLLGRPLRSGC